MKKIKRFFLLVFKTRWGRNILFCILFLLGVLGVSIAAKIENSQRMLFVLFFSIGVSMIMFSSVYLSMDYFMYGRKIKFLKYAYNSLFDWVKNYDIGNATNLVKSLSNESDVEVFFRSRQEKILKEHKESYELKWIYLDKNSFLIETIRELIDELDVTTRSDLFFLEKYLDYEIPITTFREKMLNGLVSLSGIAGFLACFKFSIDILLKGIETKNDDIFNLGIGLIIVLVILFILVCALLHMMMRKRNLERNSKNFLDLLFKVLKEDDKSE